MHEETLYINTRKTLDLIKNETILEHFYLAGGTALALQLGHRKSIDLDFFASDYPSHESILQDFKKYSPRVLQQAKGTLDIYINDVKVSFFESPYRMIDDFSYFEKLKIAGILDISCMKLLAISQRGTKKDFVDLFVILQNYSIQDLIKIFEKKYSGIDYSKTHLLKSLVYFEDAEKDPEPDYIHKIDWELVKTQIRNKVLEIA